MAVLRPDLMMQGVIPVVMAGILAIVSWVVPAEMLIRSMVSLCQF